MLWHVRLEKTSNTMSSSKQIKHEMMLVRPIIGIDGEGWNIGDRQSEIDKEVVRDLGRNHVYGLMVAADETGKRWELANAGSRLGTKQVLHWLFKLPPNRLIVAYSFKYDLTKMLEDLPDELLYWLNHVEDDDKRDVEWEGFHISYLAGKFTVRYGGKQRVIWDFFKFYATSFVNSLKTWKVSLDVVEQIKAMKDKRGEFKPSELPDIARYCYNECVALSKLARKLIESLTAVQLDLDGKYHGAGSVGGALLKRLGADVINIETKAAIPDKMKDPLKRAFFGGRFETSKCGSIVQPSFEYDISSAYPYQMCFIPCMKQHCGTWRRTKNRRDLDEIQVALVHYELRDRPTREMAWGPFPFRLTDGTIVFPHTSGGGWAWLAEYLEGEAGWDNVQFVEAWIWVGHCNHEPPFKEMAQLYIERNRLGKNGPGLTVKLGINSGYGKTAQTVGKAQYQNWIWAGMITSGCRAQLLYLMRMHDDMSHIFMLATDGLYSTESLTTPTPKDTGTGPEFLRDPDGNPKNCPLGGWEKNPLPDGMFVIRPGIYFKLNHDRQCATCDTPLTRGQWTCPKCKAKGDDSKVRSRGIGAREMTLSREQIISHYERSEGKEPFSFALERFCGMKTSTGARLTSTVTPNGVRERLYYRRPYYGRWCVRHHDLSFDPRPKRGDGFALRGLPEPEFDTMSAPYAKATAEEIAEGKAAAETAGAMLDAEEMLEQPDYLDELE